MIRILGVVFLIVFIGVMIDRIKSEGTWKISKFKEYPRPSIPATIMTMLLLLTMILLG